MTDFELPPHSFLKEAEGLRDRIVRMNGEDRPTAIIGALVTAWNRGRQYPPLGSPPPGFGPPPPPPMPKTIEERLMAIEAKLKHFEFAAMHGYGGK